MMKLFFGRINLLNRIIIVVIICQIFGLLLPKTALAIDASQSWSWTDAMPTVFSKTRVFSTPQRLCQGDYHLENINTEQGRVDACVTGNDKFKYGIYFKGNTFRSVVSFAFDDKMHPIIGSCSWIDDCLYLSGPDILVKKQTTVNGIVRPIVVFKNFSHRLIGSYNFLNNTAEYRFDSSNPDYYSKDADQYAAWIGGIGASSNGEWVAVELKQFGIGLLNVQTMQMRRISTMIAGYGVGSDPTTELAVSNDGRHVVVMGANSGFTIIGVNPNCGDEIVGKIEQIHTLVFAKCVVSPMNEGGFIYQFLVATHPNFSDDGGELNFFAVSWYDGAFEVILRAAGNEGQKLEYLALGDSFTSGEGEFLDEYYLNGTNSEYEKCHVSSRSYPFLIASLSGIDSNLVKSVACSGATTEDVVGDDLYYKGQNDRLGIFSYSDRLLVQSESKSSLLPGRIHQQAFVGKYLPNIISLGIGGNDAGFIEKLKACLGPITCNWAADPVKREQVAVEIKDLFDTLVNTYSEIHASSLNSKIYVVGYPKMVDETGTCDLLTGFMFDKVERKFMNEAVSYLNQVIEAAAKKVGIKYLDIQDVYGDQVLCGKSQPTAINSVMLGDDVSLIGQSGWLEFIGNESFHPNPIGHSYAAQLIFASIGSISLYNYCANGMVVCPQEISVPEPSNYWISEVYHDYPKLKLTDFMLDRADSVDNRQKQAVLPSRSLMPNSSVVIEINSEPYVVGEFNVSDDGGLDVEFDLPIDFEEGYHTVHIYGTSYSGNPVDLYQVIEYKLFFAKQDNQQQPKIDDFKDASMETNSETMVNATNLSGIASVNKNQTAPSDSILLLDKDVASSHPIDVINQSNQVNSSAVLGASDEIINTSENAANVNGNSISLEFYLTILLTSFVIVIIVFIAVKNKR